MSSPLQTRSPAARLIVIGLFIALEVILTRFLSIDLTYIRIGFGFLPIAMLAVLYGPVRAGLSYAAGDILGMLLFPKGPFFPGFTASAFLTGAVFGLFLYGKEVSWRQTLPAALLVCFAVNFCLDSFWLYLLMGRGVIPMLPFRLLKSAVMCGIQTALIPLVWNSGLRRILSASGRF